MDKEAVFKWVKFISFGILLFGGLNWLLIGLFETDIIAGIFGGMESVASRVFYSFFGLAAIILLAAVLWRAFAANQTKEQTAATTQNNNE